MLQSKENTKRRYRCDICLVELSRGNKVRHKEQTHDARGNIYCVNHNCQERFYFKQHFTQHFREDHSEENLYRCNLCDKSYRSSSNLIEHKKYFHKDNEKRYPCDFCDKKFGCDIDLIVHDQAKHSWDQDRFQCDLCTSTFDIKRQLEKHLSDHLANRRMFVCKSCSKVYYKKASYDAHVKKHKKHLISRVFKGLRKEKATSNDKKLYNCNECWKSYTCNYYLKIHQKKHMATMLNSKRPDRRCKTASKTKALLANFNESFSSRKALKRENHEKKYREAKNDAKYEFDCDVPGCDRNYKHYRNLYTHMKSHNLSQETLSQAKKKFHNRKLNSKDIEIDIKPNPNNFENYVETSMSETVRIKEEYFQAKNSPEQLEQEENSEELVDVPDIKPFCCIFCDKLFGSDHLLVQHSSEHMTYYFKCPEDQCICGYSSYEALITHQKLMHNSEPIPETNDTPILEQPEVTNQTSNLIEENATVMESVDDTDETEQGINYISIEVPKEDLLKFADKQNRAIKCVTVEFENPSYPAENFFNPNLSGPQISNIPYSQYPTMFNDFPVNQQMYGNQPAFYYPIHPYAPQNMFHTWTNEIPTSSTFQNPVNNPPLNVQQPDRNDENEANPENTLPAENDLEEDENQKILDMIQAHADQQEKRDALKKLPLKKRISGLI